MKKGKLLIIDDNEDILFALNLLLEPYMEQIRVATQPERIDHLDDWLFCTFSVFGFSCGTSCISSIE